MRDEDRLRKAAEKQLALMHPTLEKMQHAQRIAAKAALAMEPALRQLQRSAEIAARAFEGIDFAKFGQLSRLVERSVQTMRDSLPANWEGHLPADVATLLECADEGIPITWVPPLEVITALAEVDPENRLHVLAQNADSILESVRRVADELEGTYSTTSSALAECVTVAESGYHRATQALASSTISHILVHDFQFPHLSAARKAISTGDVNDVAIIEFRALLTLRPLGTALGQFKPTEPAPTSFNRHATAHSVSPDQLTELNALVALMLAASLAAESARAQGAIGPYDRE